MGERERGREKERRWHGLEEMNCSFASGNGVIAVKRVYFKPY
jgi:hypothetical protein